MILLTGASGLVGSSISGDNIIRTSTKDTDLRDFSQVCKLFEKYTEITGVIHLAANVGGLFKNMREPVEMLEDNLLINLNILKAAHKYNVNKVLCCLSTCIFPDKPSAYPLTADMLHEGAPHPSNEAYAHAKRMMEIHCRAYRKEYNREYFCVVPTNIYGPHDNFSMANGHVIPSLIHKCYLAMETNTDFIIAGDGTPLRQFVFNKDLGKMIMWSYENPSDNPILLCPPESEVPISKVVDSIVKAFKFTGNVVYDTTKPNGQHKKTTYSSNPMNIEFTPIENGIQETVDWFIQSKRFRKLNKTDYMQYLELISTFRHTDFTEKQFVEYLSNLQNDILVMEKDLRIVATVTVIYEKKLIKNISMVGHIEDVCVLPLYRGRGYGSMILKYAIEQATIKGCYKTTLVCSEDIAPFYISNGFEKRGAHYSHLIKSV